MTDCRTVVGVAGVSAELSLDETFKIHSYDMISDVFSPLACVSNVFDGSVTPVHSLNP